MIEAELHRRPYDAQAAELICARLRRGRLRLNQLDQHPDLPDWDTVADWLDSEPEFVAAVARARRIHTELMGDEALSIADEEIPTAKGREPTPSEHNTRTRRRMDIRMFLMAKRNREQYGRAAPRGVEAMDPAGPGVRRSPDPADPADPGEDRAPRASAICQTAAQSEAFADHALLKAAAEAAIFDGTIETATALIAGDVLPLAPLAGPDGELDDEIVRRDIRTRLMSTYIRSGAAEGPEDWGPGADYDAELLARLVARTDPPRPVTGEDLAVDYIARKQREADRRGGGRRAILEGQWPPPPPAPPDDDDPDMPTEQEEADFRAYVEADVSRPGAAAAGLITPPPGYERCRVWLQRHWRERGP